MALPLIAAALAGGLAVAALSERHKATPTSESGATTDGQPVVTKTDNSGVGVDASGDKTDVKQTDSGIAVVEDDGGHAGPGDVKTSTTTRTITDPAPPTVKASAGIKLLTLDRT